MKKVLFTIQWYKIPSSIAASANALCDEYIIDELKKDPEIEIHTLSYHISGFPLEDVIDGVHIHRFKRSKFWNDYILIRNNHKSLKQICYHYIHRFFMRFKQILFYSKFPNYEPMQTMRFEKEALKLHKKYNFDFVISEFNGFDSVTAGATIKKRYPSVKFLPICWDSIGGGRLAKWMPASYCRKLRIKAETQIMNLADAAIVMKSSENFNNSNINNISYRDKFIFLDVPYFKKCDYDINTVHNNESLTFLYSGTMGDRNPRILLETLDKLKSPIIFTFICPISYHDAIYKLQNHLNYVTIKCLPYMQHEELVKYQVNNDVLVNFGVLNTNAVSGKIFDYMSRGKPIISTIAIDDEACIPYMKKYPKSLVFDERKDSCTNVRELKNFISRMNTIDIDLKEIEDLFYNNTPTAYINVVKSLLS